MKKMSIHEAVERGLSKLRRDPWEPSSRMELDIKKTEGSTRWLFGPWATIRSSATDAGVGEPAKVLLLQGVDLDAKEWEEWTP